MISLSQRKISHFINRSANIQYWIAIEPDSEFLMLVDSPF